MDQETEVLLYCLGTNANEKCAARLEQLLPSDWEGVIQRSMRHVVAPLLYHRLKILSPRTNIPVGIVQRLREIYLHNAAKNMQLYTELSKLLRILKDDGIPVIVLKGAYLAEVVYDNIALRPMCDIDLLVKKVDLSRVEKRLLEMGYSPLRRIWIEEECALRKHLPPFTKAGAVPFEIHWTLVGPTNPFNIDVSGLWKRARTASIASVNVLVLSPEDLLLLLCLHASFIHVFPPLYFLCDISETIRHYKDEMDWNQVQLHARQWGVDKCVYLTLRLTRDLLGAVVPDELLRRFQPVDLDLHMITEVREGIFADKSASSSPPLTLAELWGAKRLRDITIFLKRAFPSPKIMSSMYPAAPDSIRIYLYYFVRLKQLFLFYSRHAWRLFFPDKKMMALVEENRKINALRQWLSPR